MAQPNTINPYPQIGTEVELGLNSIIATLPVNPTIDDLVDAVYNYIQPVYYINITPTSSTAIEIKSVAYQSINSYRDRMVQSKNGTYEQDQFPFIEMLIGDGITSNLPPSAFVDRVADIEDNIGTSNLIVPYQLPLFLATMIGTKANQYWIDQLANPMSSWVSYFASNAGENYMNTLQWSVAAMNGALAGYGATAEGMISPTTAKVSTNMISALIGGLTVTAGKLIFNWIPRITKPLQFSVNRITTLNPTNPNPTPNVNTANCFLRFTWSKKCKSDGSCGCDPSDLVTWSCTPATCMDH